MNSVSFSDAMSSSCKMRMVSVGQQLQCPSRKKHDARIWSLSID